MEKRTPNSSDAKGFETSFDPKKNALPKQEKHYDMIQNNIGFKVLKVKHFRAGIYSRNDAGKPMGSGS